MADVENALPIASRLQLRNDLSKTSDPFISQLPKVELHIHIEGCITPELRWKFSQRNKRPLIHPRTGAHFNSLLELQEATEERGDTMNNTEETLSFFEAYYGGISVLETEQDYYDLAMHYFTNAASHNIRYAEIFFDPQAHTNSTFETIMAGFRTAQQEAERTLNLKSNWIMCFLRDSSPESAMTFYDQGVKYRDMIIGIGLDSNEKDRPPNMFAEVFARARKDGLRVTAHCDVGTPYPVEHARQCLQDIKVDRVDHGLNVVRDERLLGEIKGMGMGMTICPWSYIRHQPFEEVFEGIRKLFDEGVKMAIGSDDPAFMEDTWVGENLRVLKMFGGFTNEEICKLVRDSVEISWAEEDVKRSILEELERVRNGGGT